MHAATAQILGTCPELERDVQGVRRTVQKAPTLTALLHSPITMLASIGRKIEKIVFEMKSAGFENPCKAIGWCVQSSVSFSD